MTMLTHRRLFVFVGVGLVALAVALWLLGPMALARVAQATYWQPGYRYTVAVDTATDTAQGRRVPTGLLVGIQPARTRGGSDALSPVYLARAQARLDAWSTALPPETLVDTLIVFTEPLPLEDANALLDDVDARTLIESAMVGHRNGLPYAGYLRETGMRLGETAIEG